jgi:hypothetical protein
MSSKDFKICLIKVLFVVAIGWFFLGGFLYLISQYLPISPDWGLGIFFAGFIPLELGLYLTLKKEDLNNEGDDK